MLVRSILKAKGRDVFSVSPHVTVIEATKELKAKRIGALLVCDAEDVIVGVLSERDIVRALAERGAAILEQPVSSLMTRRLVTCDPDDNVDTVMGLMTERRVRHIPVVEDDRLYGLISIGDAVKFRLAETMMEAEALKYYIVHG